MPLNKNIKKVMLIGSGPITIGQAAEFDYAGTQALRVLKNAGIEVVLVNSNPATIMTDNNMADSIYLEPLTEETIQRIIIKEKPDSILSGLGGQTGLNLCMKLAKSGFLKEHNVTLLGSSPETIDMAEDRQDFKDAMERINQPCIPSKVVTTINDALEFAEEITYPVIVRPAFTLGGSGGGIADTKEELNEIASTGIAMSPIGQILVEKSIAGWKEVEFEVMRDNIGNAIAVCSMENFDPVGIHTGDSIVIAPAVTLADKEYQMLRTAALNIIQELGVCGGCNCQFALNPETFDYAVIEVNPRVSRSSALASKATGYPIAKVATKIAIGYTLDEIVNEITGKTYAAFEPAIDYVAVKFPKWPFDKFVYARRKLGTQMQATGEVMAISENFEAALLKAVRGAEIGLSTLNFIKADEMGKEELIDAIKNMTDERIFYVYSAIKRGMTIDELHELTWIDEWFLYKLKHLADYEKLIAENKMTKELFVRGKILGYTDKDIEKISGNDCKEYYIKPYYRMVDTCGGEFMAETPYFYSVYGAEEAGYTNEATCFVEKSQKERVIVFGSGPIRIGQGIEFDYACVNCVWALKNMGYEVIVINNNPETVSTDFDTADRLYFEPLYSEDVLHIIETEKPIGVVVAFGGQTAIKLTNTLSKAGIKIIGTSADSIDRAEDRERFEALLEELNISRPNGATACTTEEALKAANEIGYPVLMRPSYVLGGQNMIIAFSDMDINEYMQIILQHNPDNVVLIDKYVEGLEVEVDAICDGDGILIPGVMEHVERTGVHSGDSIAIYPAPNVPQEAMDEIYELTKRICISLEIKGLVNIQYIYKDGKVYIIEVNPRASRTIPYLSKVTGVPMVDVATKASIGVKLSEMGYDYGIYQIPDYVCAKVPVFSFEKLADVDTQLGPEMKSTGEVLGIGRNIKEAIFKGLVAAGYKMKYNGAILITVKRSERVEVPEIAKKYAAMGFELYATEGNAKTIRETGLKVTEVRKIHEPVDENSEITMDVMQLLDSGALSYIISTSAKGRDPQKDSVKVRRRACQLGIPCLTSIDTADALADSLASGYSQENTELVDINTMRISKEGSHN